MPPLPENKIEAPQEDIAGGVTETEDVAGAQVDIAESPNDEVYYEIDADLRTPHQKEMDKNQLTDVGDRLLMRRLAAGAVFVILIVQNWFVGWLIAFIVSSEERAIFLPVVTVAVGVIVETVFLVKIVVNFLFTEITYPREVS